METPKPVAVFHSTLPVAEAVLSNQVTSEAQMCARKAVQGSTMCCCTQLSRFSPNIVSWMARKIRKKRSMAGLGVLVAGLATWRLRNSVPL